MILLRQGYEGQKIIKKTNLFYALLFVALTFSTHKTHTMEPISEEPVWHDYTLYVGDILLGKAKFTTNNTSLFGSLPSKIKDQILHFLSIENNINDLKIYAQGIRSIGHVDQNIHALIDEPHFCLQLIKHLAQRFNCSDHEVARRLNTKETKRRLNLQIQLYNICMQPSFSSETGEPFHINHYVHQLSLLKKEGVDLEFSYAMSIEFQSGKRDVCITPLMITSMFRNLGLTQYFIQQGCNVNHIAQDGETALMFMIEAKNDSAKTQTQPFNVVTKLDIVDILLGAGADPEITDNDNESALSLAQEMYQDIQKEYDQLITKGLANKYDRQKIVQYINDMKKIVERLQGAVKKKHGKK